MKQIKVAPKVTDTVSITLVPVKKETKVVERSDAKKRS